MSKNIYLGANVETTDTFAQWMSRTNQLVYDMGTVVLTAGAVAQPNTINGAMTTGNTHLQGISSANTLVAGSLRGGSVSVSGPLNVTSNTIFSQAGLVHITGNTNSFLVNANNTTFTGNFNLDSTTKIVNIKAANTTISVGSFHVNTPTFITSTALTANVDVFTVGFDLTDTMNVNATANFNENVLVDADLNVTGAINANSTFISNLSSEFKGDVILSGATTRELSTKSNTTAYRGLIVKLVNSANSVVQPFSVNSTNVSPMVTNTFDLGTDTQRWRVFNARDISATGNTNVAAFTASANSSFGAALNVIGDLTLGGKLTVSGTQALTTSTADINQLNVIETLNLNSAARVTSNIIPVANTHSLGADTARWTNVVSNKLTAKQSVDISTALAEFKTSISAPTLTLNRSVTLPDADVTLVSGVMVPTTLILSAGDGISGGGTLSANRTFAVDSTVLRNSGNQSISGVKTFANTISGSITGNSGTATKLITARAINGVAFDGTAPISILAASPSAVLAGDGLSGGFFDGAVAKTFTVDSTVVRTTRLVGTGDGLTGGGGLDANRTLAVDGTVVRTSGTQTIAGVKTFSNEIQTNSQISYRNDADKALYFRKLDGAIEATILSQVSINALRIVNYKADNITHGSELRLTDGGIVAQTGRFEGNGSGLTLLDAGQISSGTVNEARLSSNVVLANSTQTISGAKTFSSGVSVGSLTSTGSVVGSQIRATAGGTITEPAFTFGVDLDTGIYTDVQNSLKFTTGGAYRGEINPAGFKGAGGQLTGLDGSAISLGTVADARLTTNVVLASSTQTIAGAKTFTNTVSMNGVVNAGTLRAGNGSVGVPSISFGSDTNTGIYSDVANEIRFSTTGGLRVRIGDFGILGNGANITSLNAGNISTGTVSTARLPSTIVYNDTVVTAGNGLGGGGALTGAGVALNIGTPGSITATSTNSTTTTSHTHSISEGQIRTLVAQGPDGSLGTYMYAYFGGSTFPVPGSEVSGGSLKASNSAGTTGGATLSGSWRCMGDVSQNATNSSQRTTLWLRIG